MAINNTILYKSATEREQDFTATIKEIWQYLTLNGLNVVYNNGSDADIHLATNLKEFIANTMTNINLQRELKQFKTDDGVDAWTEYVFTLRYFISRTLGGDIRKSYLERLINTIGLHIDDADAERYKRNEDN